MRNVSLWVAAAGLALAVPVAAQSTQATTATPSPNPNDPGSGRDVFVTETEQRTFTVTGTVVREGGGRMVVRIDDHGHRLPFEVAPGAAGDLQPGSRVAVTYRPTGATGQRAEQVQVLEARSARGQRDDDRRSRR